MARNGDLRRAILDESRRLLLEQGYGHVSMRKVAAAVGCTATSIYLHFDSKDALIHALIEEGMDLLYADLEKAAATDGPAEVRYEALCRAFLDFGLGNPEYYEIMFQLTPREMQRYPSEKYRGARRRAGLRPAAGEHRPLEPAPRGAFATARASGRRPL
jgi:AcrR family transcriptional regulator